MVGVGACGEIRNVHGNVGPVRMDVAAVADAAILVVLAELELDVVEVQVNHRAELRVQAPERTVAASALGGSARGS